MSDHPQTSRRSKGDLTGAPSVRSAPSRGDLGHALFRLWLLNVLAGTLVGSLWFFDAPVDRAPWIRVHLVAAFLGWVGGLIGAVSWQVLPMFYLAAPLSLPRRR